MKIKHGKNIKIFTCDVRNLPNNFVDLASRSYNNYGVFYITGIYSRNEVKELRSNIDTLYKEDGNKRRRFVADISDVVLKKKLSSHGPGALGRRIAVSSICTLYPVSATPCFYISHHTWCQAP